MSIRHNPGLQERAQTAKKRRQGREGQNKNRCFIPAKGTTSTCQHCFKQKGCDGYAHNGVRMLITWHCFQPVLSEKGPAMFRLASILALWFGARALRAGVFTVQGGSVQS
jgi:hypothetical protein